MTSTSHALAFSALLAISGTTSASVITEDFSSGSWDTNNFELEGAGTANTSGYNSSGINQRGLLRTVDDSFTPSTSSPLVISADLTTFGGFEIAFLAFRSSGVRTAFLEPNDSVYLRLHNFQNGHTGISGGTLGGYSIENPGDSFWGFGQTINVNVVDDGALVTASFTNTVTNASFNMSLATTNSYGGYVAFSTSAGARWDNISISGGMASVPAPASLSLALVGLILAGRCVRRA